MLKTAEITTFPSFCFFSIIKSWVCRLGGCSLPKKNLSQLINILWSYFFQISDSTFGGFLYGFVAKSITHLCDLGCGPLVKNPTLFGKSGFLKKSNFFLKNPFFFFLCHNQVMVAERLGLAIRKQEHNLPLPAFNAALCKPLTNKYRFVKIPGN